jgi:hypothetical protein
MNKLRFPFLLAAMLVPIGLSGCYPLSMGIFTPIPVPPWTTERMEEKVCHKNDFRTPVLPPIKEGAPPPICEDEPDDARILRAMQRVPRGVPYYYEEHRDNIQISKELIVDKIDPARFFPLVGLANLHHCHWKCTVYYTETVESGYPFPYRCVRPRVQVVYIDLDHLHLCPGGSPETRQIIARELSGP